jgi:hypothetical protein
MRPCKGARRRKSKEADTHCTASHDRARHFPDGRLAMDDPDVGRVVNLFAAQTHGLRFVVSEGSWFLRTRDHWDRVTPVYARYLIRRQIVSLKLRGKTPPAAAERAARHHPAIAVPTVDDLPGSPAG